jgi:hypothetical protein
MAHSPEVAEISRRMWDMSDLLISTSGVPQPLASSVPGRHNDHKQIIAALRERDQARARRRDGSAHRRDLRAQSRRGPVRVRQGQDGRQLTRSPAHDPVRQLRSDQRKPRSGVGRDGRSDIGDITPAVKGLESMTPIMPPDARRLPEPARGTRTASQLTPGTAVLRAKYCGWSITQ